MYAIVEASGKQYLVGKNDKILVHKMNAETGSTVVLDRVLLCGDERAVRLGTPHLGKTKTSVKAKVLRHTKGDKITVFKRKRRKNYRRSLGHRQDLTLLHITDIVVDGKASTSSVKASPSGKPTSTGKAATGKAQSSATGTKAVATKQSQAKPSTAKKSAAGQSARATSKSTTTASKSAAAGKAKS